MEDNSSLNQRIFIDWLKYNKISLLTGVVAEFFPVLLLVISARVVSIFLNSVLNTELNNVLENIWLIVLIVGVTILIIPLISITDTIVTFKTYTKYHSNVVMRFLDKAYLKAVDYGSLSSRWEIDVSNYSTGIKSTLSRLVSIVLSIITLILAGFFQNITLMSVCIISLIIPSLLTAFSVSKQMILYRNSMTLKENTGNLENNLIEGFEYLKYSNCGKAYLDIKYSQFDSFLEQSIVKDTKIRNLINTGGNLATTVSFLSVMFIGFTLVAAGNIQVSDVVRYVALLSPLQLIFDGITKVSMNRKRLKAVVERIRFFYIDKESFGDKSINKFDNISINDLTFSYDGKTNILENLSMNISSGDHLIISGANGSGKTSLASQIASLILVKAIYANGVPYEEYDISLLRTKISMTFQKPYFFEGSVYDNINIVNSELSSSELTEFLNKFKIDIDYEYELNENNTNLSGGELQKLSIIRSLIKCAEIYIFDEPSNNMDELSIKTFIAELSALKSTVIVISHAESVINQLINNGFKQIHLD